MPITPAHLSFTMPAGLIRRMATVFLLAVAAKAFAADTLPPLANQLRQSPSPYLLAHSDDPVAWQEWNAATVERARRENKLLYLSIGYFSCHWCHVMQAESYRNPDIAAIINQNFIPVKIDRELNVALDAQMIEYAESRLGVSGWPLNVFVTPDGYPLYAILYQPPQTFHQMLDILGKEWLKDSAGLTEIARKSMPAATVPKRIKLDKALAQSLNERLLKEALAQADMLAGGLNVPRKFPLAPQLLVLLEMEKQQHDAKLAEWLTLTLDRMMQGGLRDHIGGGFFRYTTDPSWQRPHFEKMLYDNALLAVLYLRAAEVMQQPAYREIATQALAFMQRDMLRDGGMITSISAVGSSGKEGEVYLWHSAQLAQILDAQQLAVVTKIWGMAQPAEYADGYLPLQHIQPDPQENEILKAVYPRLLQVRQARIAPLDTKQLASLNGLALLAFSEAASLSPAYRQTAGQLRNFIVNEMLPQTGLLKGISNHKPLGPADLEAYAYVSLGLQHYAGMTGNKADAALAGKLALQAWKQFYSDSGFALEQQNEWGRKSWQPVISDGPLPSPAATLMQVSLMSADKTLRNYTQNALALSAPLLDHGVFWDATQVAVMNRLFLQGDPRK